MQEETFQKLVDDLVKECKRIHKSKGKEYTMGNSDTLYNFKNEGKELGLTALQVWSVYFSKHIASIKSFVKFGGELSEESIRGRFIDAINYLLLGYGIIKDKEKNSE